MNQTRSLRDTVFISKATPGDDDFALWLAPRLEAAGYKVFADILSFDAGDRWRLKLTSTLQNSATKMLLCCRDSSLVRHGVDEEISIAQDLSRELDDPNFILPLRLERFKKLFGIGGLQYIDFEKSWADGLSELLKSLDRQNTPKANSPAQINPEWENYQKRQQVTLEQIPEPLTSNWLKLLSAPDTIKYLTPKGSVIHSVMAREAKSFEFPLVQHNRGFFGFCDPSQMESHFKGTGPFLIERELSLDSFLNEGVQEMGLADRAAKNIFVQIMRMSWEAFCRQRGLIKYEFSAGASYHVSDSVARIGQRIPWGRQGSRRSSMLRNIAKKKVWEFGMSAIPSLFPFPHFRLKSRVLFSDVIDDDKRGATISDPKAQHRLRRSVCSPWRNPAWHGRLMAYLEVLAPETANINLPVAPGSHLAVEATPLAVTSPVSTRQAAISDGDAEEADASTLPPYFSDEEED
ncbi:toll/interleukin-1 receptor domain-containing protein [Henriciella algicola]|uniref:Toll/interleukin-1 receptor domain-containing protein n=1 Tax=Henriciella algicola TaxID=1608422 RepID=A0A399RMI9_9PROT|nr:toll/interleukin-1 receptor domain-containing protein [Henriciella algicola]RIJ31042.1 toll/interleukin-1 receptor domain-containing protein [Henriciella algicola]